MDRLPRWADVALVPLVSLTLAAIISALVIIAIGQDPWEAITVMVEGSVMNAYGWGYTLYYATSFIFTGLAVTVAFHAGLFNIGGEGQAQLGGLGVAMAVLFIPWPHWTLALLAASGWRWPFSSSPGRTGRWHSWRLRSGRPFSERHGPRSRPTFRRNAAAIS